MTDVIVDFGLGGVDDNGDEGNDGKGGKATENGFGDEALFGASGFTSDGLGSLGDVVEILEIIHMLIIAYSAKGAKH